MLYEHSPRKSVMRAHPISARVLVLNDPSARGYSDAEADAEVDAKADA